MCGAPFGPTDACRWNQPRNGTILYSIPAITDTAPPAIASTPIRRSSASGASGRTARTHHTAAASAIDAMPSCQKASVASGTRRRRWIWSTSVVTANAMYAPASSTARVAASPGTSPCQAATDHAVSRTNTAAGNPRVSGCGYGGVIWNIGTTW